MKNFILGVMVAVFFGGIVYLAYRYGVTQQFPKIKEPAISPTALLVPSASPLANDDELVKKALIVKNNWDEDMMTITVSTNDGKYASGTVTADGGGGYFFAAKVDGVWKIVADGNGVIFCSNLKDYPNYPTTLIPECYDEASSTSIKR